MKVAIVDPPFGKYGESRCTSYEYCNIGTILDKSILLHKYRLLGTYTYEKSLYKGSLFHFPHLGESLSQFASFTPHYIQWYLFVSFWTCSFLVSSGLEWYGEHTEIFVEELFLCLVNYKQDLPHLTQNCVAMLLTLCGKSFWSTYIIMALK